jgi:hypothetical protein
MAAMAPPRSQKATFSATGGPAHSPQGIAVEGDQDDGEAHGRRLGQQGEGEAADRRPAPPRLGSALGARVDGAEVGEDGQEREASHDQIAPLGDPGDRFDAQRVDAEDERGRGGSPPEGRRAGGDGPRQEPRRQSVDEQRVERVQG